MNRRMLVAAGCLAVAVALVIALARTALPADEGLYSVPALRARLARDPGALTGRTIRVRGTIPLPLIFNACDTAATACATQAYLLYPADQPAVIRGKRGTLEFDYEAPSAVTLPLVPGREDSMLAALRRVPLLDALAPPPQRLRFGTAATYRVRTQLAPAHSLLCLKAPCWMLVLLDPAGESL